MDFNKISNITAAKTEVNTTKQTQEQKPNLKSENDSVEIKNKKKNRNKKIALGAALSAMATAAIALAIMVGRNPAKAAKVLKGTSEIFEPAFKDGQQLMNKTLSKTGNFATTFDDVLAVFKKSDKKSVFNESLDSFGAFISKQENKVSDEVKDAYAMLKKNLDDFHKKIEQDLIQGKKVDYTVGEKFAKENSEHSSVIKNYLDDISMKASLDSTQYQEATKLRQRFDNFSIEYDVKPFAQIKDCPKDILPADGIFYHGTAKTKNIYQKGFSPYASRQVEQYSRELGSGIYVTPDINVAANFSGLSGSIIPVKISGDSKIALVTEDVYSTLSQKINKIINERFTKTEWEAIPKLQRNTFMESMFNKAFKDAGYDAAYLPKGVKGGGGLFEGLLTPNVNEVFGRNQSQVVLFTPEKLEIVPRTFKERVCDLKAKFSALKAQIIYAKEHPYGF